jgi:hypothetical protein
VHTYAQCAAVRTHVELMREPPQNHPLSIMRATIHGTWPRAAGLPPVIRLACSFRDTWTFPAKSATHINTFQCSKELPRTMSEWPLTYLIITSSIYSYENSYCLYELHSNV